MRPRAWQTAEVASGTNEPDGYHIIRFGRARCRAQLSQQHWQARWQQELRAPTPPPLCFKLAPDKFRAANTLALAHAETGVLRCLRLRRLRLRRRPRKRCQVERTSRTKWSNCGRCLWPSFRCINLELKLNETRATRPDRPASTQLVGWLAGKHEKWLPLLLSLLLPLPLLLESAQVGSGSQVAR